MKTPLIMAVLKKRRTVRGEEKGAVLYANKERSIYISKRSFAGQPPPEEVTLVVFPGTDLSLGVQELE
jgi:hypothetical protein